MRPKLACADFTFPILPHSQVLQLISMLGLKGVDIGLFEDRSHLQPSSEFANVRRSARRVRKQLEDTGLMFLGPIIGDYVCTGVGTCLVTGSCIGTGAMISLSTLAPKYVGRLTFCTDAETQRYEEDRFIGTAQRMMARRHCTLSPAEEERLRNIIRTLIEQERHALQEVGTPDIDPTPNKSTGINVLEDLLKKIVPIFKDDFRLLTTNEDQRKSFRAHICLLYTSDAADE